MSFRIVAPLVVSTFLCVPSFAQDLGALSAPEVAAPGTAEGAGALREALARFVTQVPFERNVLRIEPDSAGQRIVVDPAAILTELLGSPVRFAPFAYVVSERPDGNWNVFSRDPIDLSASFATEGQESTFSYRQGRQLFKGVYSPALASFLSATGGGGDIVQEQSDPLTNSRATIRATDFEMTSRAGGSGGVDVEFRQGYDDWVQADVVTVPQDEGAEPLRLALDTTIGRLETSGTAKDARTVALLDLYALVLRHADALEADAKAALAGPLGAELKQKLSAVLPLWASLEGRFTGDDMSIVSPFGNARIGEAAQTMRLSGVDTDASFETDIALRDIALESPALPAWSASLLPEHIEMGFAVTGADLATPASIAIEEADFSRDEPLSPDAARRIGAAFGAERIEARIKPSRIRSEDLDIALSGDIAFAGEGEGAGPTANVAIDVGGLDAAIATLQAAAAGDPSLHQPVGMLQMAKGMARPKADGRLEWIVAALADGSVTVNGTVVKGPDPAPGAGPDAPADEATPDDL